jgi:hypothetical protein
MQKASLYSSQILVSYADAIMLNDDKLFTNKMNDVFIKIAVDEVQELRQLRNIKTDAGLVPIFKEQRQKYLSICNKVNIVKKDLLQVTDFDEVIKEVYPSVYDWYVANVVAA